VEFQEKNEEIRPKVCGILILMTDEFENRMIERERELAFMGDLVSPSIRSVRVYRNGLTIEDAFVQDVAIIFIKYKLILSVSV